MPVLLLILLLGVFLYAWLSRRGSSLTRSCRWRRTVGPEGPIWRCAACGAETRTDRAAGPRDCLRPAPPPPE